MAKGKARTFGQALMRGEHVVGTKAENAAIVAGNEWGNGGPARRDPAFYAKKREWEKQNGREISTTEFREKYWDGAVEASPEGLTFGEIEMTGAPHSGTSIFDPVLCELSYRWFCPPGGTILDPFAGGSVRGIVASKLGRRYVGVELRPEQVAANREQGLAICDDPHPEWIIGDSRNIATLAAGAEADFVFSCPPYGDLEVYSDDPADLSTLPYADFRDAYFEIIAATCSLLKPDRFAAFVVGDFRDKRGNYVGFVPDTVAAFQAAGLELYNEAILVTAAGSLPIRAGKQFEATRKLGKTHQNVLVFVKGDARAATAAIGPVEFGEFDEPDDDGENAGDPAAPGELAAQFGEVL